MNLYNCKLGQIVITGDSYGVSPCLVVAETHHSEELGFNVVTFLDLTTGVSHESGGISGQPLDYCQIIDSVSPEQAQKIKDAWGYKDIEPPHKFNHENKCVHTEHCCASNGCKYGEEDSCPVWLGYAKQSYGYWDGEETLPIPNIPTSVFLKRREEANR